MSNNYKVIAQNKQARFNYELVEIIEAGIVLMGSEVKSLRLCKTSINESFVWEYKEHITKTTFQGLFLLNATISEYPQAKNFGHTAKRPRALLLKKKQLAKFQSAIHKKGMTIVPLRLYFNNRGIAKLEIALAKGKQTHDKRQTLKDRDWNREKGRILKNQGRD